MLFNTVQFLVFFLIVYSLYLVLNHRWQNRLLLLASYLFYCAWDWRFLFLILAATAASPIWSRSAAVSTGEGASSMIF